MLTVLIKDPDTDEHYGYQVKLNSYSDTLVYVSLLSLDQQIEYYQESNIFLLPNIAVDFINEYTLGDAKKFAKRYRRYRSKLLYPDGIKL